MKALVFASAALLLSAPAFAQDAAEIVPTGDAAAGEEVFNRQCMSCHVVVDDAGETLAGRNAQTGPNLYAVVGRSIGTIEGFRYSDAVVTLAESEAVWDEASFVGYVMDPSGWLREATGDRRARGLMSWQVRQEEDALNVFAYLGSLAE